MGNAWEKSGKKLVILVACTKNDVVKSKPWRRVKLQIKSELEKLRKISINSGNNENNPTFVTMGGKSVNLDDLSTHGLDFVQLAFCSVSGSIGGGDNGGNG